MVDRKILRRVAAILYHRRAGFSANGMGVWKVPEDQILEVGGRMAATRGISHCYQRPTYDDWPYSVFTMAHGRSKEECDAVLDSIAEKCEMGPDDRATLYSSTEYKKIRLHYFTPDYAEWEAAHSLSVYDRARAVLPGGVNSPVRAMRQIGREPIFIERGEGVELVDVEGNRYIDWVCSWGPLILGHADPAVVSAVIEAAKRGTSYGAATAIEVAARRAGGRPLPLGGDGADDQLRHRGGDERGAPGAGAHRARGGGQVRGRLPRPLRRPAGRGRLGDGDALGARQPGRAAGDGGADRGGAVE